VTAPTKRTSMYDDPDRPCLGLADLFFSPDWVANRKGKFDPGPAKVLCFKCPHRTECLDTSISGPVLLVGVWGGMDDEERKAVKRCRDGKCTTACLHIYREEGSG
jgi:hypothetical protein